MGATETFRDAIPLRFSTKTASFPAFSTRRVPAAFLGIQGSLSFAEETYRRHENTEEIRRAQEQKAESADEFLLRKLIRWYIDTFKNVGKWQRTRQSHLEFRE